MKKDSISRFSNRVDNYVKYRSHYPPEIIDFLKTENILKDDSVIADIGSGTGISSELFLQNGNTVYGVEPNNAMRSAAERLLSVNSNFSGINGTAENTTLENNSIDIVLAGQAFHWFDKDRAKSEFRRILKPGGRIILMWNIKIYGGSPLMNEYLTLLINTSPDYNEVKHENVNNDDFYKFFDGNYKIQKFDNRQVLDYEGFKGRLLSSSYVPTPGMPGFETMIEELRKIFDKYNQNGKVTIKYETKLIYGK